MSRKFSAKSLKENSNNKKIVAFIPVRGGSKSIPKKNIQPFAGQPLIYWTAKAANDCSWIDEVVISTDDELIKDTVMRLGLHKTKVIARSEATATDEASTESAMLEYAEHSEFDYMVLIQATSPLLESKHLEEAFEIYADNESDSMLSVVRQKRFIWEQQSNGYCNPVNYDPSRRPRRQEFSGYLVENGAFYITSKSLLMKSGHRISGNVSYYEMEEESYFEIDEPSDWVIAESLKLQHVPEHEQTIDVQKINLLISDVDGVLTDAGMYYSERGDELKKFNTRDGKGIELIRQAGIQVMILTAENVALVQKRAEKLNVDYVFMGIKDKKKFLEDFFITHPQFSFDSIAYIGDDVNDLESLKAAYLSAAPKDAHPDVLEVVDLTCNRDGGQGCVRELCDFIIKRKH